MRGIQQFGFYRSIGIVLVLNAAEIIYIYFIKVVADACTVFKGNFSFFKKIDPGTPEDIFTYWEEAKKKIVDAQAKYGNEIKPGLYKG